MEPEIRQIIWEATKEANREKEEAVRQMKEEKEKSVDGIWKTLYHIS